MTIRQSIRGYILENYLFTTDESALADGDSLLARGLIDSTGVLELVMYIEEQFGLTVADDELIPDNLDSVDAVVAFVERKGAGPATAGGAA